MLSDFISSWELFKYTYLCAWAICLALSLPGVLVVARDQIFIGAAISQASTLGVAVAMAAGAFLGGGAERWYGSAAFISAMAVAFSIAAALATAARPTRGGETHEALTGWIFLFSSGLSILIVSKSPHGMEEINRILSSSIIGATQADAAIFGALFACAALALLTYRRQITLLAIDPEMAAAHGIAASGTEVMISAWLGLTVGLSIRVSGMLFTFGCLVLPALIAKNLAREIRSMFITAPLVSIALNVTAFVAANYYDFPPAQLSVSMMSLLLPAAWAYRANIITKSRICQ